MASISLGLAMRLGILGAFDLFNDLVCGDSIFIY